MARPELFKHWKLRRFAAIMRLQTPFAVGILETLWNTAYETGDPYIGTSYEVKMACMYEGDDVELANALADAGFLNRIGDEEFEVHDLHENAPSYVRDRWRKREKRRADVSQTSPGCIADKEPTAAQVVAPSPPLPSLHNTTEKKKHSRDSGESLAGFDEWYELYGVKLNQEDAKSAWKKLSKTDRSRIMEVTRDYLDRRKVSESSGEFVPRQPGPGTYLRKKRWNDVFNVNQQPVYNQQVNILDQPEPPKFIYSGKLLNDNGDVIGEPNPKWVEWKRMQNIARGIPEGEGIQ
jgi:hypothetical protein